jgi:hypothetical protein
LYFASSIESTNSWTARVLAFISDAGLGIVTLV